MTATKKHYRVCNLCEAMCGLEIEHDEQRVISVKGDVNDPFSKGSLCPKGALIHKICLLYTSPSPRDQRGSRMPSSA